MWSILIAVVLVAVSLYWCYGKWKHNYWASKGIKGPKPVPFVGSTVYLVKGEKWNFVRNTYNKYKADKVFGMYQGFTPSIFVCDADHIRRIMIKDFDHFTDRRAAKITGKYEWFNEMLTATSGKDWKRLRSTLSPTFSSGKLKFMYQTVYRQASNFVKHCSKVHDSGETINMKNAFGRYTMDVIASTAFGMEINSLSKEESVFTQRVDEMFKVTLATQLRMILFVIFPLKLLLFLRIPIINESFDFFYKISKETISERRKSGEKRGDFLNLLLDEQENQKENFDEEKDFKITDNTILAQSVLFIIAGYDTTANTLSFTSHFLAKYPDIQEKVRQELHSIIESDGKFDYHKLMEAKYLEACINESLRLASPAYFTERKCVKDYVLPDTNITIPEGMHVGIPTWGLHHDPEFWPNPDEFNPDRFLPENKANIVPGSYLPFGLGPRNCIAMRFALMEAKLGLAELIMNFKFTLAPGLEELTFDKGGGVIRPSKNGVTMVLEKCT